MRFLNHLSLQGSELRDAVVQVLGIAPATFNKQGRIWISSNNIIWAGYKRLSRLMVGLGDTDPDAGGPGQYAPVAYLNDLDLLMPKTSFLLPLNNIWVGDAAGVPIPTPKSSIPISDWGAANKNVSMGNYKITDLEICTSGRDAANKDYVDQGRTGLLTKPAVDFATTGLLPAHTVNAPLASGGSMTATVAGVLVIDGTAVVNGDRILVKDETKGLGARAGAAMNGIYVVTNAGSAYAQWILTRADDADASGDSSSVVTQGITAAVLSGALNAGTQWVLFTSGTITLNTTEQDWQLTAAQQDLIAGAGLIQSGTRWDVDLYTPTLPILNFYGASDDRQLGIKNTTGPGVVSQLTAAGVPNWLVSTTAGHVLRISAGPTLAFGFISWTEIPDRPTTLTGLTGYSVLGNPDAASKAPLAITATPVTPASGLPRPFLLCEKTDVVDPKVKFGAILASDLPSGVFHTVNPYSVLGNPDNALGALKPITATPPSASPPVGSAYSQRPVMLSDPAGPNAVKFGLLGFPDLPDATAWSVLGRSVSTAGDLASIQSTADNQLFARTSNVLGWMGSTTVGHVARISAGPVLNFGFVDWTEVTGRGVLAEPVSQLSVLGNPDNASGPFKIISATAPSTATSQRPVLLCGLAAPGAVKFSILTFSDLPIGTGCSVVGRAINTDGPVDNILATTNLQICGRLSNSVVFAAPVAFQIPRKYAQDIVGTGVKTAFPVAHNLGSSDIVVEVFDVLAPFSQVVPDVERQDEVTPSVLSVSTVTLRFATAPANGATYRVVVTG